MSETNYKIYASKDWVLEQLNDQEAVTSVNGATGDVTLAASDVGALPLEDYYGPTAFEEDIVSFNSLDGLGINATSVIEPVQAGTGEASPDNVRAISGFDKVELTVAGKNLCPGFKIGAYVNTTGVYNAEYTTYRCTELIYVEDGEKLIASHGGTAVQELCHCFDAKMRWLGTYDINQRYSGTTYIAINYLGTDLQWVQVERGETATEYEPYKGITASVDLPSTTYGGTYDWKTGKLVVDRYGGRITSSMTWELGTTSSGVAYVFSRSLKAKRNYNKLLCSHCPINADNTLKIEVSGSNDTGYIQFTNMEQTTVDEWNNYIDNNDIYITYELETPETYYLTPHDLKTLEGLNTIWSNCGPTKGTFNTFVTEVTEKELNDAIDNIEIGGRNLLKPIKQASGYASNISVSEYGFTIAPVDQDTYIYLPIYETLKAGEEYTLSWECNGLKDGEEWNFSINNYPDYVFALANGSNYITFIPSTDITGHLLFDDWTRVGVNLPTGTLTFTKIKLEKGNKPTDWTPALEDVNETIELASQTVKSTVVAPSSMTKYYLLSSDNSAEETDSVRKTPDININVQAGTTSTPGIAQLILGNNSAAGTAGNSTGYITLYSDGGGSHRIYPGSSTTDSIHTLPGVGGGTLISTKNYTSIPSATTSSAGLMSAADKQKLEELVSGDPGESTITYVTAGNGLTGGGASGNVTLNVGAGSGIKVAADSISVNTDYTTSGKNYKVQVDSTSGGLFVNVPWTDNNTTYVNATQSAAGLMSAADKTKLDDNVVLKMSGDGTYGYVSYRGVATKYFGGTIVPYIRIALPSSTPWGMFTMRVLMRESYSTGNSGEILIYGNHNSNAEWNTFNATCIGNLSSNVKVYGSDKKYFYISCGYSYSGVSVEEMIVGDSATSYDLRNITIDYVSELPATYQTATMYYTLSVGSNKVVAVNQGGTGATTAATALTNLGAVATNGTGATGTWGISISGNAATATKATQDSDGNTIKSTYLKLSGGTMTGSLQIGNSSSSATTADAVGIAVRDLRAVYMTPDTLGAKTAVFYFDDTGPSGDAGWKGILRVKGWDGAYAAWELAGPASESDTKEFYVRSGVGGGSWGAWRKLLTNDNYTSYTVTKTGSGATGTWGISIQGNATSATRATQDSDGNTIGSTYLKLSGGTLTGTVSTSATVPVSGYYFRNINIEAASTSTITAGSSLATGTILIKYQ